MKTIKYDKDLAQGEKAREEMILKKVLLENLARQKIILGDGASEGLQEIAKEYSEDRARAIMNGADVGRLPKKLKYKIKYV